MTSTLRFVGAVVGCVLATSSITAAEVTITVVEKSTGLPVPCRIHLRDAAGVSKQADGLPFWCDHFVCPGEAKLTLPPGRYDYEIERGPEYGRRRGSWTVDDTATTSFREELVRIADLAAEGWWSGEMHVHRPPSEVALHMRAEDLHVAQVITWWCNRKFTRSVWNNESRPPEHPLVQIDANRYYHLMAGEDERTGGALLYFNLPRPFYTEGATPEYPSPLKFAADARRTPGVWIDAEKTFWWDFPVWLASGQVDSIGLAYNHLARSKMYDNEAWGKARDRERLPPPHGNGLWAQEIYYHVLNCGLRIPPSAGSASGVLDSPVGYDRMYVQVDGEFTYEKWFEGLRAGRVFVTNGPLLRAKANGRWPGQVIRGTSDEPLELELTAELTGNDAVPKIEIVQDGRVVRSVSTEEFRRSGSLGKIRFDRNGWFLIRAIADVPETLRFASTGPFYVEILGSEQTVHRASAQFFLDWVRERRALLDLPDPVQRREVEATFDDAVQFWERQIAEANAD